MTLGTAVQDALAMMIAPLTADAFFDRYYERSYYRCPQKSAQAADLLSLDRVDEILSDSELPPSSISMARSGEGLPAADYTFDNGVIDRGAVLDLFREGATLILPQLHFADGRLYEFCLALERQFGARIQTNVYLTPANAHGFGIHYDSHDVFVIQVAGAKEWEIYGERDGLPYRGEGFRKDQDDPGELRERFVLEQGECLYVPRGTAHRASNHGTAPSLHITVGILVQTWAEFMLEAVAEASLRIPEMRRSLPRDLFFGDRDTKDRHAETFHRLACELAERASFETTLAGFSGNFVSRQGPRLRGALTALAEGIGPDDLLTVRDHTLFSFERVPREDDEGWETQIILSGTCIPMSDELAEALRKGIEGGPLRKRDFSVADRAELDDVIDTLVAYGLLVKHD